MLYKIINFQKNRIYNIYLQFNERIEKLAYKSKAAMLVLVETMDF